MRRSAGFYIVNNIITSYQGDSFINEVMADRDLSGYIKQETLSRELIKGIPEDVFQESFRLNGHEVILGVKKVE
jgi:hypothetical protein